VREADHHRRNSDHADSAGPKPVLPSGPNRRRRLTEQLVSRGALAGLLRLNPLAGWRLEDSLSPVVAL